MPQTLWIFQALGGAVLWGLAYALSEKLLRDGVPPAFFMFLTGLICMPFYVLLVGWRGEGAKGLESLLNGGFPVWSSVLVTALCVVLGNLLILFSIAGKNATMSALVEISYPLFTALFAWFLLREAQLSAATALGALLIFSGVAVIYFKA